MVEKTNPIYHVPFLDQLVEVLDEVVIKQAGPKVSSATQRIRHLAIERRAGMPEAEERLVAELNQLDVSQAADVIRAFTMYFDLANLAEELNRIRTLRRRSRISEDGVSKRSETISKAIAALKQQGYSASDIQLLVGQLRIEPVFTAHPSEAKRRTTRQILRRLRETLVEMVQTDASSDIQLHLHKRLRADLTTLWQSDLIRPRRPAVMSEVKRGLFFANVLWEVVPEIKRDLREALVQNFPGIDFHIPPVLRFGTWIGGDRDGHPFVTTETTAETMEMLRATAIKGHLKQCRDLMGIVVMSERHTPGLEPLKQAVQSATEESARLQEALLEISETEICRQWLKVIEFRLLATRDGDAKNGYASSARLEQDVTLLVETLLKCGSEDVADTNVLPWLDSVQSFGLHFASMDIRQHSSVHTSVIAELLKNAKVCDDYEAANDKERTRILIQSLDKAVNLDREAVSDKSAETLDLFQLLATKIQAEGLSAFGGYVISMTHEVSDALAVFWLWKQAWLALKTEQPAPPLPIVPLFETIGDLERAPTIMDGLWQIPEYRTYLRQADNDSQMVMIGYSDSTKDGGYLAASWKLHQAQRSLANLAQKHGVRMIVFHGRGGALGRGGGPAARAVLSLPPGAVNGAMRVTEQGEILAERYDDPEIAFRHLEQVTWATILVSGDDSAGVPATFDLAMSTMASASLAEYRALVTHPEFLNYFEYATPVSEIEHLPIGSRPARRGGQRSLADLRAIPWTFAWTQSRQLIPAWFGLGTAIRGFVDDNSGDWSLLREMYKEWRFFAATIDNAELALAKADIEIAFRYSELCPEEATRELWTMIKAEYDRSRAAILLLKQQNELLEGTSWLKSGIRARNPSVDPLNLLQIRMLRETRNAETTSSDEHETDVAAALILRLTINGLAAGLRTTG